MLQSLRTKCKEENTMEWELWGTFSVGDHLRRRPFVAEVLLYDRLVVPTPPDSDLDEQRRWREQGWVPSRQQELLNLIGQDRVIRVPWTEFHRQNWEARYRKAQMAEAVTKDVARTLAARKSFDWEGH